MKEIIDAVFGPAQTLLGQIVAWLSQANLEAARGMDLTRYLGQIAWMGPEWLWLIKSAALSSLLVIIVWAATAGWSLYIRLKESVKWW